MSRDARRVLRSRTTRRWLRATIAIALFLATTVRAQTGGQLDPTFGIGGRTVINLGRPFDDARAIAVQADGKLIVAGTASATNGCFFVEDLCDISVTRLNVDGSLDTAFGVDGIATAGFSNAQPRAVFVDADGSILVAGQALLPAPIITPFTQGETHLALARFDTDGELDPTFGNGGRTTGLVAGFGELQGVRIAAIDRDAGGAMAAAVASTSFLSSVALVARFRANTATLDPGFGGDGIANVPLSGNSSARAVRIQPDDGKVIVFGTAFIGGSQNVVAVRFDTAGAPDETFGDGGLVATDIQGTDNVGAAALQSDGTIVIAGSAGADLALVRYLPDGQRDTSFGEDGKVVTDIPGRDATAQALVLQPDGKIVVAGSARPSGQQTGDFLIARYNVDGSADTTFGDNGFVLTDFGQLDDLAAAVALDADGRIVAGGRAGQLGAHDVGVARYQPGTVADLTITIIGPTAPVDVGQTFDYTLRISNLGPDGAANVVIRDFLPNGVSPVVCHATSGGVCIVEGGRATIRYASIPGGFVTVTLRVTLSPAVPDGTSLTNTATVVSDAVDPDPSNNSASLVLVARAVPHTLRFFLHGTDIAGTAGGFTMNATPAAAQPLKLNLRNNPSWFSDPALSGVVAAGGTMRLIRPCTLGVGLAVTYRLAKTDLGGGNEQALGATQRLLAPCVGQEVISIPVATPVAFANERVRLTISSGLHLNLDLQLGEGTLLEITNFAGTP
jgi:uncharacterized delta-60 repeat protein/uncharacterized repeat protein (TIGR01451 family)